MKKYFYFLLLSLVLFVSCNEDSLSSDISQEINTITNENICFDVYLIEDIENHSKVNSEYDINSYGALLKYKKWENGKTIRIKFLNGTPFLQSKIKQFANEWLKYANLNFEYVNPYENADIRINFDNSGGSWSYIGTDCNYIDANKPTMNFGWFNSNTPDYEFSRTVIHEFGHALGLVHEHQSPASGIQWNKQKVYEYYGGAPNYWSKEKVDQNIFYKYDHTITNYSSFDNKSIMLYSFPSSLSLNGWSSGWNTVLSVKDKEFIAQLYPGKVYETQNLYRYFYDSRHFYTSDFNELGYRYLEGILGKIYSSQIPNTYPIYRYYNRINGDRLSTINWNELQNGGSNGWVYEGITGYAYNSPQPNTIPVYRFFREKSKPDHLLTTKKNEVQYLENKNEKWGIILPKYKYEGIAFYILK